MGRIKWKEPRSGDIITAIIMPPLRGSEKIFDAKATIMSPLCGFFGHLLNLVVMNNQAAGEQLRVNLVAGELFRVLVGHVVDYDLRGASIG